MRFLICCPLFSTANNKQNKAMTLPLRGGTSSPLLLVPSNNSNDTSLKKLNTTSTVRTQSLQRNYVTTPKSEEISSNTSEQNRVGQSVFYDCTDGNSAANNPSSMPAANSANEMNENKIKLDKTNNDNTDEEISEIDQGCTIFSGVTYLGAANINAPKSEIDVYRIMSELNSGSSEGSLKISISIPNSSDGLVV